MSPGKWQSARMRAAIVREFLASDDRTVALADRFAARLGVSRNRLYALARAFRAMSEGSPKPHGCLGQRRLHPDVEDVVAGAIRGCGPAASPPDVWRIACAMAAVRGMPNPAASTVNRRLSEHRALEGPFPKSGLALDETDLELGVATDDGARVTPTLSAILDLETGEILGHALTLEMDRHLRAEAAVADALRRRSVRGDAGDAKAIEAALSAIGDHHRGSLLLPWLGGMLGPLHLLPRLVRSERGPRTPTVDLPNARRAVSELVEMHNRRLQR